MKTGWWCILWIEGCCWASFQTQDRLCCCYPASVSGVTRWEDSILNESKWKHAYEFSMCCQRPRHRLSPRQNDCWLFYGECENMHSSNSLRWTCYCSKYFVIMKRAAIRSLHYFVVHMETEFPDAVLSVQRAHMVIFFESHCWKDTGRFAFKQSDTI